VRHLNVIIRDDQITLFQITNYKLQILSLLQNTRVFWITFRKFDSKYKLQNTRIFPDVFNYKLQITVFESRKYKLQNTSSTAPWNYMLVTSNYIFEPWKNILGAEDHDFCAVLAKNNEHSMSNHCISSLRPQRDAIFLKISLICSRKYFVFWITKYKLQVSNTITNYKLLWSGQNTNVIWNTFRTTVRNTNYKNVINYSILKYMYFNYE
jgi:hypothetical protein